MYKGFARSRIKISTFPCEIKLNIKKSMIRVSTIFSVGPDPDGRIDGGNIVHLL